MDEESIHPSSSAMEFTMTAAIYELKASCAFIERNINIVKRYWAWEIV
jgi:hypothetical protein